MTFLTDLNSSEVLECIQHGVIITDLKGRMIYSNSATEQTFGYSEDEIVGEHIRMLYGDEDFTPFRELIHKCIHGSSVRGNWHGKKKSGDKVWLDVRAKMIKHEVSDSVCLISLVEIEKLIHAEQRLKRNEALSHAIFNASTDAIITFNESGEILSCNRAALSLFGYQKEELKKKPIHILFSSPFSEQMEGNVAKSTPIELTGIIGRSSEIQGINRDQKVFPLELNVTEVEWEGAKIYTGIIRDLSARRYLERRILESGQEERRNIGRELHDGLGQMLTGIRMLSENLAKKLKIKNIEGADEVGEIAKMVHEADEFARTLARGLVQVDLEKKGLSVALQNICNQTEKLTGVTCEFYDLEDAEVKNHSLGLHLYRITQEAINNAIKHGDPDYIRVRLSNNEYHTALSIFDNGVGFPDNPDDDCGSGIEIMKHRARIMGGILEISRTTDGFTQVRCIIPNNLQHFD
jgi:PAS domain S-box-containing protein